MIVAPQLRDAATVARIAWSCKMRAPFRSSSPNHQE
jgi:hypothetical protein